MSLRSATGHVLLIETDRGKWASLRAALKDAGIEILPVSSIEAAYEQLVEHTPEVVLAQLDTRLNTRELLAMLRTHPIARRVPFVFLAASEDVPVSAVAGLAYGADEYVTMPYDDAQVVTYVKELIRRPHIPRDDLIAEPTSGLFSERVLLTELEREMSRACRPHFPGAFALVGIHELDEIIARNELVAAKELTLQIAHILNDWKESASLIAATTWRFAALLPAMTTRQVRKRLRTLQAELSQALLSVGGEQLRITPYIGYTDIVTGVSVTQIESQAVSALCVAQAKGAGPVRYTAQLCPATGSIGTQGTASSAVEGGRGDNQAEGLRTPMLASGVVLLWTPDEDATVAIYTALANAGYQVLTAATSDEARSHTLRVIPDVIVVESKSLNADIKVFADWLRSDPLRSLVPVIFADAQADTQRARDVIPAFDHNIDMFVAYPLDAEELVARVTSVTQRVPAPRSAAITDLKTGAYTDTIVSAETALELARPHRGQTLGCLIVLALHELGAITERFGRGARVETQRQVREILEDFVAPLGIVGKNNDRFIMTIPETNANKLRRNLRRLIHEITARSFKVSNHNLRLTPVVGFTELDPQRTPRDVEARANAACNAALDQLDLEPVEFNPALHPRTIQSSKRLPGAVVTRLWGRIKEPVQIILPLVVMFSLPFALYVWTGQHGFNLAAPVYLVVVASLLLTAIMIWAEAFMAIKPTDPPGMHTAEPERDARSEYPQASAIVAAYLPNEAATIEETIEAFLANDYPKLQVVLAYNTPYNMPVETRLAEMARHDPRFTPYRVQGSTSKAQNVNSAIKILTGEFVGIFDADHHPAPNSFRRAWRWIAAGYDVVQGHCVVRNGETSWVARMVAIEFEAIYAVSHPGRTRLHTFGIFGGSNGYWRTELLRATRMHGFMLTEDIDSSMRLIQRGHKIATDRDLRSTELAPLSLRALWNQRMRWAQGWVQVSVKHQLRMFGSHKLNLRQKIGTWFLLMWREFYIWISLQIVPILIYAFYKGGFASVDWFVPVFVATTLITLSVGPAQTLFAYILADPLIKPHRNWFWAFLVESTFFYTEFKNAISRTAQAKQIMHERKWKVTPRDE